MDKISGADKKYRCECCGEPITREEYISQGFDAFCKTCKKLSPKKRQQRAYRLWESEHKDKI